MGGILIFAGTTEGRDLSQCLAEAGVRHTVCVATEYGAVVLQEHPLAEVCQGRMDLAEIKLFLAKRSFAAVVDATHPYAQKITENVKMAAEEMGIPCLRLKRDCHSAEDRCVPGNQDGLPNTKEQKSNGRIVRFQTVKDCANALKQTEGNILLTTGSKELPQYCICEEVKQRLYVRILPSEESFLLCKEQGICGKQIIAMHGPFSAELNEALIHQYNISCLVTKESGAPGGWREKLEAAAKTGIQVFAIAPPKEDVGYSFLEVCRELERFCHKRIVFSDGLEIILAGAGMGSPACLTKEVQAAIEDADILLGAERIVKQYRGKIETQPYYTAAQIIPYLKEVQSEQKVVGKAKVVVLFSGDSGYHSGCRLLHDVLQREIKNGRLHASVHIMPGISSVAYLAAQIGESYEDASVFSIHGKTLCNLAGKIKNSSKTFLLMSGWQDVNRLGELFLENHMESFEIVVGCQLSYKEQNIQKLTPQECCEVNADGLYTCFIKNLHAVGRRLVHGRKDDEFVRGQAPMTKEEVREVSICKLQLHERAVVYDIGSGSGSCAVEIAALSDGIQVYAIEKKRQAFSVMEKNRQKFGLENISFIAAAAPEGLKGLPAATHAFIGGSGGRLREILTALYECNPRMRIVINAVSMETICAIREILASYPITKDEIVQIQANRIKEMGNYHLMQAENPVWIFSFQFDKAEETTYGTTGD